MTSLHRYTLLTIAVALSAAAIGCRAAPTPNPEVGNLLQIVSYESDIPTRMPPSSDLTIGGASSSDPKASEPASFKQATRNAQKTIGKGLRSVGVFLLRGVGRTIASAIGWGDEDDDCESESQADQEFNQWLDDREDWRSNP